MILNAQMIGTGTGMLGNATSYPGFSTYTFQILDNGRVLVVNPNTGVWKPVNLAGIISASPAAGMFTELQIDNWVFLDQAIRVAIVANIAAQVTLAAAASPAVIPMINNTSNFQASLIQGGLPYSQTGSAGECATSIQNWIYGDVVVSNEEGAITNVLNRPSNPQAFF